MSFCFTNIGDVCITQTFEFVNDIRCNQLRGSRFEGEIIRNFKCGKNWCDVNSKIIIEQITNLILKIMRQGTNKRYLKNVFKVNVIIFLILC